jgi:EF-P beta-lysylation protein EpmB
MEVQKKQRILLEDWQKELSTSYKTLSDILERLKLDPREAPTSLELSQYLASRETSPASTFKPLVPEDYLQKIEPGNWQDPLLLQVLPQGQEDHSLPGYKQDAVGDLKATVYPGLLHKYHGRALLIPTSACAIHCRYCFRKEFPYKELQQPYQDPRIWSYLKETPTIQELIVSGGDPLTVPDSSAKNPDIGWNAIVQKLLHTPHIRTLRIHTRIPVVLPSRITSHFLDILQTALYHNIHVVLVLHINHPNELQGSAIEKIQAIHNLKGNITLLNQAVLLKGVNDKLSVLKELSQKLFQNNILPYYLHQLDRVVGTHHFEVPIEQGKELVESLRKVLPGYLVPRYVQEIAGEPYKSII